MHWQNPKPFQVRFLCLQIPVWRSKSWLNGKDCKGMPHPTQTSQLFGYKSWIMWFRLQTFLDETRSEHTRMIPEARIALSSCRWFRIFDPKNHDLESFNEVVKKTTIILDANFKRLPWHKRIYESIRNESFLPVDTNMFHYRSLLHTKNIRLCCLQTPSTWIPMSFFVVRQNIPILCFQHGEKKQTNLPILFNQTFSEAYTGPVAAYPTFHSRRSRTETFPTMGWCNKSMRPQPCCCNKTLWMWTITSDHMKWVGLIRILSQCNIEFIWNL